MSKLVRAYVVAFAILMAVSFGAVYGYLKWEEGRRANARENARVFQHALEQYSSNQEDGHYPETIKHLIEAGYLRPNWALNPFSGNPPKVATKDVDEQAAFDLLRGRISIPEEMLSGLSKGDLLYFKVKFTSWKDMPSSYMIFVVGNPKWHREQLGSPADTVIVGFCVDFRFETEEKMIAYYSNCPYAIGGPIEKWRPPT